MKALAQWPPAVRQYLLITINYWTFTLTDGALRMLVVLYFYQLGYSPLAIAMLFLFYEFFGIVTNLVGGWLGARIGLNKTMNIGLAMQVLALAMLLVPSAQLTVAWVMAAQALSGIAKDLNKMSAKSAIKQLVPADAEGALYRWVALLTGSKNTLKGIGFFVGGALLTALGFRGAIAAMLAALVVILLFSLLRLKKDLGKAKNKPKFSQMFSKSPAINILSAARLFLFAARDIWFVVALPVYLASEFSWGHWQVGGFLALWVIGYGIIQALAPALTGRRTQPAATAANALFWAVLLSSVPATIAVALSSAAVDPQLALLVGLTVFGVLFAINSSLHSYLIVSYASHDGVSMDVGFYYMANAAGRLLGTVLSGWLYQQYGLTSCLWVSSLMIASAALLTLKLQQPFQHTAQ